MSQAQNRIVGTIHYHDASIMITEDMNARTYDERKDYEADLKNRVFQPIVKLLRKLGWTVVVPKDLIERYSREFANDRRYCRKGDLEASLAVTGRTVQLEMWQSVANIDRKDGDGRYEFDKVKRMPYLIKLEMLRTRKRITETLLAKFPGYVLQLETKAIGLMGSTALEYVTETIRSCTHFKPDLGRRAGEDRMGNNKSMDGKIITHGNKVWTTDNKGRVISGIAHYNINGMWFVISGKYGLMNMGCSEIMVDQPEDLRERRNSRLRRSRLEKEIASAVGAMNYKRAEVLKSILFPSGEPLFVVRHTGHSAFHRPNFQGYTTELLHAGKFMKHEIDGKLNETDKPIELNEAEAIYG